MFLPHFDVFFDLLGSLSTRVFETRTATARLHGSLSNLNAIILKRNEARGEIVDDLRPTTEDSSASALWMDDHFKRVLKKLVHSFIDAENCTISSLELKSEPEPCSRSSVH